MTLRISQLQKVLRPFLLVASLTLAPSAVLAHLSDDLQRLARENANDPEAAARNKRAAQQTHADTLCLRAFQAKLDSAKSAEAKETARELGQRYFNSVNDNSAVRGVCPAVIPGSDKPGYFDKIIVTPF